MTNKRTALIEDGRSESVNNITVSKKGSIVNSMSGYAQVLTYLEDELTQLVPQGNGADFSPKVKNQILIACLVALAIGNMMI